MGPLALLLGCITLVYLANSGKAKAFWYLLMNDNVSITVPDTTAGAGQIDTTNSAGGSWSGSTPPVQPTAQPKVYNTPVRGVMN